MYLTLNKIKDCSKTKIRIRYKLVVYIQLINFIHSFIVQQT